MNLNNVMYDAFSRYTDDEIIIELEKIRWPNGVVSPFDPTSTVYHCKHRKYRCRNTGRYFDVKTGTIISNTKLPLFKWLYNLHVLAQKGRGLSSYQYARSMNSTQKTGWYNNHKIRIAMAQANNPNIKMTGIIEIDEAHVGGKNINRHFDKKALNTQGRSNEEKTQVIGIVERGKELRAYVVPDTSRESLEPFIHKIVHRSATAVMTDDWAGYKGLKKYYNHIFVSNHDTDGEYHAHTNTIENSWLHLKRNYKGMYFTMDRYHVQKYVDEFVFRYNTKGLTDGERLQELLKLMIVSVTNRDIKKPTQKIVYDIKLINP